MLPRPCLDLIQRTYLTRWALVAPFALALSGCYNVGLPMWVDAPLVADGQITTPGNQYDGWSQELAVNADSNAELKFSLATLPSGAVPQIVVDSNTASHLDAIQYQLDASKIASARLVLLVDDVIAPGYLSIQARHTTGSDCYPSESTAPACASTTGGTAPANDADQPGTPLRIAHGGFFSFDVTNLVKQRIADPAAHFVVRATADPSDGSRGSFVIGSKESPVTQQLAHGARLYITLTDAMGYNSAIPSTSNVRRSSTNASVADTRYYGANPLWLQSMLAGDGAFAFLMAPKLPSLSSSTRSVTAMIGTSAIKQTLITQALGEAPPAAAPATTAQVDWFSTNKPEYISTITWNQGWSQPGAAQLMGSSPLRSGVTSQVLTVDTSQGYAADIVRAYNLSDTEEQKFAVAAISNTLEPVKIDNQPGITTRFVNVTIPRKPSQFAVFFDTDDSAYSHAWCAGSDPYNTPCVYPSASFTFKARMGQSYPYVNIVPYVGDIPGATTRAMFLSEMHVDVPRRGPSTSLQRDWGLDEFKTPQGGVGYYLSLGTANREVGSFTGHASIPGHNGRFTLHLENLPLPAPTLGGPQTLQTPVGASSISVAANAALPFSLNVNDAIVNTLDNTTDWQFSSSVAADTVPAQLTQGNGHQSFAMTFTGPGPRTLTVRSVGDSSVAASLQVIVQALTGTQLAVSKAQSVFGESVELTATVVGAMQPPVGQVEFRDGATSLGTVALDTSQTARLTLTNLPVGNHSITAIYGGMAASGVQPSESTPASLQVARAQTVTTLQLSPAQLTIGQPVTATVGVTPTAPGAGTPTGSITVSDGTATCSISLPASSCPLTASASGTLSLTAQYAGDASFAPSTGQASAGVGVNASAVDISATPTAPVAGDAIQLTASVQLQTSTQTLRAKAMTNANANTFAKALPTPGGSIRFSDNGKPIGTAALNATGTASLTLPGLAYGNHNLQAVYSGDGYYAAATSQALKLSVGAGVATPVPATSWVSMLALIFGLGCAGALLHQRTQRRARRSESR